VGIFEDIAELFSDENDQYRRQHDSEWSDNSNSLFPRGLIGSIIENEESVRSSYRSLLSELREESRQRLNAHRRRIQDQQQQSRERLQQNLHRISGNVEAYIREVMGDVLEHEQQLAEMGIVLDPPEPVQNLERVNWKKEGF